MTAATPTPAHPSFSRQLGNSQFHYPFGYDKGKLWHEHASPDSELD